jgi:hypothetical protein
LGHDPVNRAGRIETLNLASAGRGSQ